MKLYERCIRCGRKLKNEESKELGFGKVCWEKWNAEINARVRLLTVLRQVDLNENYASMLVRNVYIKEEVSNG